MSQKNPNRNLKFKLTASSMGLNFTNSRRGHILHSTELETSHGGNTSSNTTQSRRVNVIQDVKTLKNTSTEENIQDTSPRARIAARRLTPFPNATSSYDDGDDGQASHYTSSGKRTSISDTSVQLQDNGDTSAASLQCITSTDTIATSHYRTHLERYQREVAQCGGDAAQINGQLNSIFIRRLEDIDCKADGDLQLRLITYQEWVDLLLHINMIIFGNITQMETESFHRIRSTISKANQEQREIECDNRKLRKDICTLIKIIQNGYHKKCWNFDNIKLETLTLNQVLGTFNTSNRGPKMEPECEQISSLSAEIFRKHEEIAQLKCQICDLEDKVQTANHKLIFKDEAISCLREKIEELEEQMSPTRFENIEPCGDKQNHLELQDDVVDAEMLHALDAELDNLMKMSSENKMQCFDLHRNRLSCIFQKLADEKATAYNKLNQLRSRLLDLENDKCNSQCSTSSGDLDQDSRVIDTIRMRLNCLNIASMEARKRIHQMQMELQELQSTQQSQTCLYQRTCQVLKEIADLLCTLRSEAFTYEDIYCDTSKTENPFCVAIMELYEKSKNETEAECKQQNDIEAESQKIMPQSNDAKICATTNESTTTKTTTTTPE